MSLLRSDRQERLDSAQLRAQSEQPLSQRPGPRRPWVQLGLCLGAEAVPCPSARGRADAAGVALRPGGLQRARGREAAHSREAGRSGKGPWLQISWHLRAPRLRIQTSCQEHSGHLLGSTGPAPGRRVRPGGDRGTSWQKGARSDLGSCCDQASGQEQCLRDRLGQMARDTQNPGLTQSGQLTGEASPALLTGSCWPRRCQGGLASWVPKACRDL